MKEIQFKMVLQVHEIQWLNALPMKLTVPSATKAQITAVTWSVENYKMLCELSCVFTEK